MWRIAVDFWFLEGVLVCFENEDREQYGSFIGFWMLFERWKGHNKERRKNMYFGSIPKQNKWSGRNEISWGLIHGYGRLVDVIWREGGGK